ncbi:MAG: hypothetical protein ABSD11_08520 [Methylocella sp.]|jgi:hypothetical protein
MTYPERKLARQAYSHRIAEHTRTPKMQDRPDGAPSGSAMAPILKSNNSSGNSLGQETAAIWRLTKLFLAQAIPIIFCLKQTFYNSLPFLFVPQTKDADNFAT